MFYTLESRLRIWRCHTNPKYNGWKCYVSFGYLSQDTCNTHNFYLLDFRLSFFPVEYGNWAQYVREFEIFGKENPDYPIFYTSYELLHEVLHAHASLSFFTFITKLKTKLMLQKQTNNVQTHMKVAFIMLME